MGSVAFGGSSKSINKKNATLGVDYAPVFPLPYPFAARDRSQHYACCLAPRHLFSLFLRRVADAAQRRLPGDHLMHRPSPIIATGATKMTRSP